MSGDRDRLVEERERLERLVAGYISAGRFSGRTSGELARDLINDPQVQAAARGYRLAALEREGVWLDREEADAVLHFLRTPSQADAYKRAREKLALLPQEDR